MQSILPKEKVKATRLNPKIIVLYSMPKVGKTTALAELDDCLILDTEGGSEMYDVMRFRVNTMADLGAAYGEIKANLDAQVNEYATAGVPPSEIMAKIKFPYRRIAIDTLDKFEDIAEAAATRNYKASGIGKSFEGTSVLELPKGAGYLHLRNEVLQKIDLMASVCETLILVCHVKDKIIDKGGVEVIATDLSLAGKLGAMVCAKADLIGYLYREPNKPLMLNLATNANSVMGARAFPHLKGLVSAPFPFAWNKLLVDAPITV